MTSVQNFVDVGDPGAPIGTPAWCRAAHLQLCATKRQTDLEVRHLKYGLKEFKEKERWRQLYDNDHQPFRSWEDYIQYPEPNGLGISSESVKAVMETLNDNSLLGETLAARNQQIDAQDRANVRPAGGDHRSEQYLTNVDDNNNDVNIDRPAGNSAAAALRRLRKDRPDIHARVLAGEITAHAGMIEAGFRKKRPSKQKSPFEKILKLLPQLNEAEVETLIACALKMATFLIENKRKQHSKEHLN